MFFLVQVWEGTLRHRRIFQWAGLAILAFSSCTNPFGLADTSRSTYHVVYNGNGNTGGTVPTDTSGYVIGQQVTVNFTQQPQKSGYNFYDWNTAPDGSGLSYQPGAVFSIGTSDVTLYAQWTVFPTYNVNYNINSGTTAGLKGTVPVDHGFYETGDSVTVLGNTGNLSLPGLYFVGWNTSANGLGTLYQAGSKFLMGTGNVTLYADWVQYTPYTVGYNSNSPQGKTASGVLPQDTNSYPEGASVILLSNTGGLSVSGYTFAGWSLQPSGGTIYSPGTTYVLPSAYPGQPVTFYAIWTTQSTYTVNYNNNGATSGSIPSDPNHYLSGSSAVVLSNSGDLAVLGKSFVGWNTAADGSGVNYQPQSLITIQNANITLYAQWLALSYTITYFGNGNDGGTVPTDGSNYTIGQSATIKTGSSLSKQGYTFVDWNTKADGTGVAYSAGQNITMGSQSLTLFAQWTPSVQTLTYASNPPNGSTVTGSIAAVQTTTGTSVTLPQSGYSIAGYTLTGWNTSADGSGVGYALGGTYDVQAGSVTLYAQWVTNQLQIIFNANGGTGSMPAEPAYTNQSGVLSANGFTSPPGYTFSGWNTQSNGSGTSYSNVGNYTMGDTSLTLYAQWSPISYTVTYQANGGTGTMAPQSEATQASFTLTTNSFTRAGYTFTGWVDQNAVSYSDGQSVTMPPYNLVLTAQWTPNSTASGITVTTPSIPTVTITGSSSARLSTSTTYSCTVTAGTPTAYQWYLNGNLVTGANSASWTPTVSPGVWHSGGTTNLVTCIVYFNNNLSYSGSLDVVVN